MASNYTTNYELPIWAAEDSFLRTEFNDANQKIDTAIKTIKEAVEARPVILTGTYQGTRSATNTHLAVLGARPRFLIILCERADWAQVLFLMEDTVLFKGGNSSLGSAPQVTRTEVGVTFKGSYATDTMNNSGTQYAYLALC